MVVELSYFCEGRVVVSMFSVHYVRLFNCSTFKDSAESYGACMRVWVPVYIPNTYELYIPGDIRKPVLMFCIALTKYRLQERFNIP